MVKIEDIKLASISKTIYLSKGKKDLKIESIISQGTLSKEDQEFLLKYIEDNGFKMKREPI